MAYDRWGMDAQAATALTGTTLADADLEAAEDEIRELIGWSPLPSSFSTDVSIDGELLDRRVWALGRAIAWQAAYRQAEPATATDQAVRVSSESVGELSTSFAGPGAVADGGTFAPRARRLLARYGWLARASSGFTRP